MPHAPQTRIDPAEIQVDLEHRGLDLAAERQRPWSARRIKTLHVALLASLLVLAVLYTLYVTRTIAFPITLAAMIALPLRPVIRSLARIGLPPPGGAAVLVVGGGLLVATMAYALWGPATGWLADSPVHLRTVGQKLKSMRGPLDKVREAGKSVEEMAATEEADPSTLKVEVKQPSLGDTLLNRTGSILTGVIITVPLLYLLLAFGDRLMENVLKILPTGRDRGNIRQMFHEAEHTISNYLLTYTAINIGLGAVIGIGLWLIGMPNPVLWGVMAGCLNFLPFLGLIVGTGIVFLVALISFDSAAYAMLAPGIYLAANGLEANIITPVLLGRSLRLNVVAIFIFIVLWGWMWGIGGALIAVPLLAVIKVACDYSRPLQPLGMLLDG